MKFKKFLPGLIFLVSLLIFWSTANPLPAGYADSDELATAGHLFSVAHPPGYGLNVILIGLFQRLLFFTSPSTSTNLLAGIFHSLTLVFLYLAVIKIVESTKKYKLSINHYLILSLGVLITGVSGLFWLYGSIMEIMSLGNLFCALVLYLAVSWGVNPIDSKKYLFVIAFTLGVGIGHLQTLVLLTPGLIYLLISSFPKKSVKQLISRLLLAIGITILGFLISSALILPLNARQQEFSWNFPSTPTGWWNMVTRQDYNGVFLDKDVVVKNPYLHGLSFEFIKKIPHYLTTTWNQYAGLPFILLPLGIYFLVKISKKHLAYSIFIFYLFAGLFFGPYVTLTDYNPEFLQFRLLAGTAQRQYLIGYTILGIFSSLGLFQLTKFVESFFQSKKYILPLNLSLSLVVFISLILANYPYANQRHNPLLYNYADLALTNAKPNSVIICASDFACFSLFYQSIVERKRPDVTVLSIIPRGRKNFLINHPDYADYLYPENPSFVAHLVAYNVAKRPTYFTSVEQFYIDYLGLNGNPFFVNTKNFLVEITKTKPDINSNEVTSAFLQQLNEYPIDNRDLHLLGFKDYLASYYQIEALYQTKYRYSHQASTALDQAIYLNPNDPRVIDWRFKLDSLINTLGFDFKTTTSSAEYLKIATNYEAQAEFKLSEESARKAYYLNPTDPKALIFLNTLYKEHDYPLFETWTQSHLDTIKTLYTP